MSDDPVDGVAIANLIGLGPDNMRVFPKVPPPLATVNGSTYILEPRQNLRPKHPTTKFIIGYMMLYPLLIHPSQMLRYRADGGDLRLNQVVQGVMTATHVRRNGILRHVDQRDWNAMISELESIYKELLWFAGSWASKWLICRTWRCKNRNDAASRKRTCN